MQAFKVHSVDSRGEPALDRPITFVVRDPETRKPLDARMALRPIAPSTHQELVRKHREYLPNPRTRTVEESIDYEALQTAIVDLAVVSWHGLIGADDQPLVCTSATKAALPGWLKGEIVVAATGGQASEVDAATFR